MRRGLLVLPLLALAASAAPADDSPRDKIRAIEEHFRKVIDAAEPSVVAVLVSHSTKYPPLPPDERKEPGRLGGYRSQLDQNPVARFVPAPVDKLDLSDPQNVADHTYGSGVVIDTDGLVLTTYHLIEGATKVYVRTASGKGFYADIHAADARSDLAVLKPAPPRFGEPDPLRGVTFKPIKFADVRVVPGPNGEKPTVARGTWVVSLGHPAAAGVADGRPSASWGILSGIRRRAAGPGREDQRNRALYHYNVLLQTDARITLGCSGAALLNLDGELIGMTTPMAAVTGAETAGGFAIPFDPNYRRIVDVLRAGREVEYGFLGVQVIPTPGPASEEDGVRLSGVIPGTPAAAAGLVGNEVIAAIDGNPVREHDDLFLDIGAALAGTKVTLTVVSPLRGQQTRQVEVTLAKQEHPLPWVATKRPQPVHGLRVDYSSVLLAQNQNPQRGGPPPRIPPGVAVRELEPGSPAESKFKAIDNAPNQWLITMVNGKRVATPAEFYREAARAPGSVRLHLVNSADPTQERDLRLP